MPGTIHVTNAAYGLIKGLSLAPASLAIVHDDLSCGPLGAVRDAESWCAMRLAFWDRFAQEIEDRKPRRQRPRRAAVRDIVEGLERIADAREIVLWIGMGLADQLMLAWMPQFLRAIGRRVEALRVVQFERTSTGLAIPGLGDLLLTELSRHPPPKPVEQEALLSLEHTWTAVTAPDPVLLAQFLGRESVHFPLLNRTLRSLFRRYPDAVSGVNRYEAQLLASTRDHGPAVARVLGETMRILHGEADRAGDNWLFWRLRRLADPALPSPAVTMTGALTTMRGTEVRLTPVGEQVAEGKLNFVRLNGIEDWIGGAHLDSRDGAVWFHRDNTIVQG